MTDARHDMSAQHRDSTKQGVRGDRVLEEPWWSWVKRPPRVSAAGKWKVHSQQRERHPRKHLPQEPLMQPVYRPTAPSGLGVTFPKGPSGPSPRGI